MLRLDDLFTPISSSAHAKRGHAFAHRRMKTVKRSAFHHTSQLCGVAPRDDGLINKPGFSSSLSPFPPLGVPTGPTPPPTFLPSLPTAPPNVFSSTSTRKGAAGTQVPAEAHAKTTNGKEACTPSPTKSLAPSASTLTILAKHTFFMNTFLAWTTCPYAVRDGKTNPDVRTLPGASILQNMPESVLFNGIAYALTKSQAHSQNAAKFIDMFFLASATAMHPNMNFGQLVRGPGKEHQMGTFTGVLDFRALVKVVNSIQILKAAKSPDWTSAREQAFVSWMKTYLAWLQSSKIGKETASKAK